jgi:putative DNA modification/repair radical SAM protein
MLTEKLKILGDAAKYDTSCASSGSSRAGGKGGFGNAFSSGICHTWSADGRCVSLLKVLMSNACIYNCAYCVNRLENDTPRASFTPEELAWLTTEFYRRNYIEGLFLSSGVIKSPDYTMELMIKALKILRQQYMFGGYIHIKVIPGASSRLIYEAGLLADRLSVNIELPTKSSLKLLAPQKERDGITTPMNEIRVRKNQNLEERRRFRSAPSFAPAGQSTQMIVGATEDTDLTILRMSKRLYSSFELKRVYFSAYMPVGKHPVLPTAEKPAPLIREHRLYQADWLMRFYKFDAEEILENEAPLLDSELDPKCAWALRHLDKFPVEVNTADYELLLRIPGIGMKSAQRIIEARRVSFVNLEQLRRMGVVMKRAQYFLTAKGKFGGAVHIDSPYLRDTLTEKRPMQQLSLFGDTEAFNGLHISDSTAALLLPSALKTEI